MDAQAWIPVTERMPAKTDGDAAGCVLAWDVNGGARLAGVDTIRKGGHVSHWMPLPLAPEILRNSADADMPEAVIEATLEGTCQRCAHKYAARGGTDPCETCAQLVAHRWVMSRFSETVEMRMRALYGRTAMRVR